MLRRQKEVRFYNSSFAASEAGSTARESAPGQKYRQLNPDPDIAIIQLLDYPNIGQYRITR
jgi:hypothetical protein